MVIVQQIKREGERERKRKAPRVSWSTGEATALRGDVEEDGGEVEGLPGPTRAGAPPAGAPWPGTRLRLARPLPHQEGRGERERKGRARGRRGRAAAEEE